jgi:hypothetical protein
MFNLGLLSDAALTGLSDEEKSSLQKQATQQFLLGSLLSNDASMGLKSALSVPDQYLSGQRAISEMQEKRRQRGEVSSFLEEFAPNQQQAQGQALNANLGRPRMASSPYALGTALGLPQERVEPQATNQPIDYDKALSASLRLSGNPAQPQIRETLSAMQRKLQDGFIVAPGGKIEGVAPRVDTTRGTVTTGTMVGGQPSFATAPISGFRSATAINALPERSKGEDFVFNANGDVVGIMNAAGAMTALAQRTATETAAREANIPRPSLTSTGAPTFTYATPPGLTGGVIQPAGVNQPVGVVQPTTAQPVTGPSTAQTILNEAYKPILTDAYKGFQTAKKTAPVIDQLQNAYNQPGFDTGSFTNVRAQLGNVFNSLGVSGERNKEFLKNATSARQAINALTGESLSEAVGAISNFEIGYYGQRNAQITDSKESTNFNLAVLREANKRKEDFYNFVSDPKNAGPDVLNKWAASPQGQKQMFESPGLRKYLPQLQVTAGPDKGKTAYQLPSGVYRVYD